MEYNRQFILELVMILLIGVIITASIIKVSTMDGKWLKVFILGSFGMAGFFLIPEKEKFFLYLAAFCLAFELDFNLFYRLNPHVVRPINGFRITIVDLLFIFPITMWIYRIANDSHEKINFHPWISIPFLLVLVWSLTSLKMSTAPQDISIAALWVVFKNWIIFLYLANNLKDRQTIYTLFVVLILMGVFQALLGIAQSIKGGSVGLGMLGEAEIFNMAADTGTVSRIGGTVGHPNKLAGFLAMLLQLNLAFLYAYIPKQARYALLLTCILMIVTMILTYSRGGMTGMLLGGAFSSWWCLNKRNGHKFINAFIILSIVVILAVCSLTFIKPLRTRFFGDDHGSADLRPEMRLVANNIIRHNPWFGVGLNNYTSALRRYDISKMAVSLEFPKPVHTEFLLIAAEIGIPGLCFFLIILLVTLADLFLMGLSRADPVIPFLAVGFLSAWLGWLFHYWYEYEYALFSNHIWLYIGLIQAMQKLIKKQQSQSLAASRAV